MAYYFGANDMCPADYAPVCGVNGKTYSNACRADVAGVAVASQGPCPGGSSDTGSDSSFPWGAVIAAGLAGFLLGRMRSR